MSDRFRSLEASLSEDQYRQVIKLLSSKRPVTELQEELTRILAPETGASERQRMKTCTRCNCLTGFQTCTQWVHVNGKWVPTVVTLEQCSFIDRFFGCLFTLISFR